MLRHDARGQLRRGPLPGVGLREAGCLSLDLLQKRAADATPGVAGRTIEASTRRFDSDPRLQFQTSFG